MRKGKKRKLLSIILLTCAMVFAFVSQGFAAPEANTAEKATAHDWGIGGTVLKAVTFSTQPSNKTVEVGDVAKFTVVATGSGTLSYQWQAKAPSATTWSDSSQPGNKTATLSVNTTVNHNGYQYRCVVKDSSGTPKESNPATLTVKPKITTQPTSKTAEVGDVAKFTVVATGKATLKYQWQAKSPSASTWSDSTQPGNKTATLSVTTNENHNGYQYRCVVTDGNGKSTNSTAATLTMKPKITTQPTNKSVAVGDIATFTVVAKGKATLKYQWQAKAPGSSNWTDSTQDGAKTATLKVTVKGTHEGYLYRCIVTDGNGKQTTSNEAKITITRGIITQPKDTTAAVGSKAKFTVAAKGPGTLKYQWQSKAPYPGSSWTNSSQEGNKTATISVTTNVNHNGYQWRCIVTDGNGKTMTSTEATLTTTDINIAANFTAQFQELISEKFDTNHNGKLSRSEINAIKTIDFSGYFIEDWRGLWILSELQTLKCTEDSAAGVLDLSRCMNLVTVSITGGCPDIYSLILQHNVKLRNITITDCSLYDAIDLSGAPALEYLNLRNNNIYSINLKGNKNLKTLNVKDNYLTKLDVSANTKLTSIDCRGNSLTSLNLKSCPGVSVTCDGGVTIIR